MWVINNFVVVALFIILFSNIMSALTMVRRKSMALGNTHKGKDTQAVRLSTHHGKIVCLLVA